MSIFTKKYLKDWLIVLSILVAIFGTVVFPGLSDYAKKPFWWKFWDVAAVVSGVSVVGGWCYLWFGGGKLNNEE